MKSYMDSFSKLVEFNNLMNSSRFYSKIIKILEYCRFCEDNGGKILVVDDDQMNGWVQTWLQNMGVSEAYLGLHRDSDADQEARAGYLFVVVKT